MYKIGTVITEKYGRDTPYYIIYRIETYPGTNERFYSLRGTCLMYIILENISEDTLNTHYRIVNTKIKI